MENKLGRIPAKVRINQMSHRDSLSGPGLHSVRGRGQLPARQRGLAVLMVLLMFALVSLLVTGLYNKRYIDVRRTSNILGQAQSSLYSLAAEVFAQVILKEDLAKDKKDGLLVDHELDSGDEPWGQYAIQIPVDVNVGIQGQIDDLMSKFNINSIVTQNGSTGSVNKAAVKRLERLLNSLDEVNPDLVAEKFVDWIDSDDQPYELKGAEDETYLLFEPPYRTANAPFNDISELWLLDGMTSESFNELKQLLSVLPNSDTRININTASAKVLRAYIPELTAEEAEKVIAERTEQKGFKKLDDLLKLDALAGKKNIPNSELWVSTEYFQVLIKAVFNDRVTRLLSTVHRDPEGKTSVLKRDFSARVEISKQFFIPE